MVQSLGHGGCERDAAKLAIGLDRSLFEVHVGVLRSGGFRLQEVVDAGIPVEHFPVNSFMKPSVLAAARKLRAYVQEHDIELIHAFDVPTDIFAALTAKFLRVPTAVLTAQLSYRSLVQPRERALLRLSDRFSDSVIVNSKAVGDSLKTEYGLPAEKVYLCYNGVNSQEFYPGEGRNPEYLRGASVVIGTVCVMRPEKRVDWMIQAFAKVQHLDPDSRMVLVGSGPEVPRLLQMRDSLGLTGRCFFEPGEPRVADWMRTMDVYINASVSESFPNALLEAMACGCCVIGSKVGGIPELISDRESGLLFNTDDLNGLADALSTVLIDPALRQSMREKAFANAHARFSMQTTIDRMTSLYQRHLR